MRIFWSLLLITTSMGAQQVAAPMATLPASQLASMKAKLDDWPQLHRYQAENAALPPLAPGEKRVIFFGSSTTDNWGRQFGSVFFPGKPNYLNRGISGQTSPQMLIRFQQDVVALHPAAVVFLGGSNDVSGMTGPSTLGMIEDNIRSIVAVAQANGIKVILASQLPTLEFPWKKGSHPAPELLELSTWERQYAATHGLTYVDYYHVLAGPDGGPKEGLSVDGLHPSAKGYAVMAPEAEKAITEALSK